MPWNLILRRHSDSICSLPLRLAAGWCCFLWVTGCWGAFCSSSVVCSQLVCFALNLTVHQRHVIKKDIKPCEPFHPLARESVSQSVTRSAVGFRDLPGKSTIGFPILLSISPSVCRSSGSALGCPFSSSSSSWHGMRHTFANLRLFCISMHTQQETGTEWDGIYIAANNIIRRQ